MTKDVLEKMNTKTPSFDLGMAEEADVGYTRGREAYLDKQSIGYAAAFNLWSITPEITSLGTQLLTERGVRLLLFDVF
ncbi:Uncharacterized protein HZ326_14447 [Fusarium oxysporum f. sp. albedinis]|nr:Uncharacterized protein HZ326_14447 [Fusarium oxysporum f. sp. albedinis]